MKMKDIFEKMKNMSNMEKVIYVTYNLISQEENKVLDNEKYSVFIDKNGNRVAKAKDESFHMLFCKSNGFTVKWGKDFNEDPSYCPFGPEIADIEITKSCRGIRNFDNTRTPCAWCYKSNNAKGDYMSFEKFKDIFKILNEPKTLTQIAFGVDAEASVESNPDIWKIFQYVKDNGVTPNLTVADITQETAEKIVSLCGAVAVSAYKHNKNCCYDSVKLLVDEAKKQNKNIAVNIHCLVSKETKDFIHELITDINNDERLKGVNAVVFLALKQKGRGIYFNKISFDDFKEIIMRCNNENISYGMDSCSANKFMKVLDEIEPDLEKRKQIESYVEPCESTQFSSFFDCYGNFYPCSFMEREGEWLTGINISDCKSINDIWYEKRVVDWRNESIKNIHCLGCNKCHFYDV